MRVLMVGCGAMASAWIEAVLGNDLIKGEIEIVGLVDPDHERSKDLSERFNLLKIPRFQDVKEAITELKPDAVFDVTPPSARGLVVEAALTSGVHVLSEKPMAKSLEEAKKLASLAKFTGKHFVITQNRRYSNGIRRIREFLDSNILGDITGIHADFFLGPRFGGFREQMDHVLLLDMAIHTFDAARFMIDQSAVNVHCVEVNPKGSWFAHGASAFATFKMQNDVIFSYRGSWCAEGLPTSWDSNWRITGCKGTLLWDGEHNITATVGTEKIDFFRNTQAVEVPELLSTRYSQGHASIIADFLETVENGQPAETDSEDNLHTISMVFAAIESAKTGKVVEINKLEKVN